MSLYNDDISNSQKSRRAKTIFINILKYGMRLAASFGIKMDPGGIFKSAFSAIWISGEEALYSLKEAASELGGERATFLLYKLY